VHEEAIEGGGIGESDKAVEFDDLIGHINKRRQGQPLPPAA